MRHGPVIVLPALCCRCCRRRPPQAQAYTSYNQGMIIPQSKVDLTGPVNEFAHRVKEFDQIRDGMDITVRHLLQRQLPTWLRPAPAPRAAPAAAAAAAPETAAAAGDGDVAKQQPLAGSKRPSEGAEAIDLPSAKRQQTAAAATGEAAGASAVAVAVDGGGPPSRTVSELQVADIERQQQQGAEANTVRCRSLPDACRLVPTLLCLTLCLYHCSCRCTLVSPALTTDLPPAHRLTAAAAASHGGGRRRDSRRAAHRFTGGEPGGSGGRGGVVGDAAGWGWRRRWRWRWRRRRR